MEIVADSGSEAYVMLLQLLLRHGEQVAPRGAPTIELRDVTLVIAEASEAHVLRTLRRPAVAIAATEAVHLVAGVSSLEQLDLASGGRFSQFADGGRLRGAYGPRAWRQLQRAAQLLAADQVTRQAVVAIWDDALANIISRDVPCTLSYQFFWRAGQLELRTSMRSNDAWLGLPYDFEVARCLLLTMAAALGTEPGRYVHTVGSLHAYERDLPVIREVADAGALSAGRAPVPAILAPPAAGDVDVTGNWLDRVRAAERVVLRSPGEQLTAAGSVWHAQRVPALPDPGPSGGWHVCPGCRYVISSECQECPP